MRERRSDSTRSRFSSPGTPKTRSTPSFSSAATKRSEPFTGASIVPDLQTSWFWAPGNPKLELKLMIAHRGGHGLGPLTTRRFAKHDQQRQDGQRRDHQEF